MSDQQQPPHEEDEYEDDNDVILQIEQELQTPGGNDDDNDNCDEQPPDPNEEEQFEGDEDLKLEIEEPTSIAPKDDAEPTAGNFVPNFRLYDDDEDEYYHEQHLSRLDAGNYYSGYNYDYGFSDDPDNDGDEVKEPRDSDGFTKEMKKCHPDKYGNVDLPYSVSCIEYSYSNGRNYEMIVTEKHIKRRISFDRNGREKTPETDPNDSELLSQQIGRLFIVTAEIMIAIYIEYNFFPTVPKDIHALVYNYLILDQGKLRLYLSQEEFDKKMEEQKAKYAVPKWLRKDAALRKDGVNWSEYPTNIIYYNDDMWWNLISQYVQYEVSLEIRYNAAILSWEKAGNFLRFIIQAKKDLYVEMDKINQSGIKKGIYSRATPEKHFGFSLFG